MKVTILCSDLNHPIYTFLIDWVQENKHSYNISIVNKVKEIRNNGDILFLVSCNEIVKKNVRSMFSYTLVLHASDLPNGRGWSPHIWDILSDKNELTITLLNAEDSVDTGDIWKKIPIRLNGKELYDEINRKLFEAEIELINWACKYISVSTPSPQDIVQPTYHRKRLPSDSKIDVNKSIKEQFNLLRVCDPNRYPAYFEMHGQKYKLILERFDEK